MYANANNIGAPREMSPLELAISSVENGLSELNGALHVMEERLATVLRPVPPEPAAAGQVGYAKLTEVPPEPSLCVRNLHQHRAEIEGIVNRINSLRARLDA